jgi:hypothetical protein
MWGTLSRVLLAFSGVTAGVARGAFFSSRLPGGGGGLGGPGPGLVACLGTTRAAPPAPRGRCSGQFRSKLKIWHVSRIAHRASRIAHRTFPGDEN